MSVVLVTGASGFIGSRLVSELGAAHDVVALSRRDLPGDHAVVRGDFTSADDLRALDAYQIDAVVHLAAELGEGSEEACMSVNVAGTRTLMRYLIDHGCERFLLASSIGVVGCLREGFMPRELPIGDDHPCDAVDAYGLSKALMEEVAFYFHRQSPALEIALFRIGLVLSEDSPPDYVEQLSQTSLPFVVGGGVIAVSDVADALAAAVERPAGPGVRRINLVAPMARTPVAVPEALRIALGEQASTLDTSYYGTEGREQASLYSIERLWEVYGFRPSVDVRTIELRAADLSD